MVICFLKFLSSSLFLCFYLDILFPLSPLSISCSIFIPPPASSLQCWALSCSVSRNYRGWIALISLYFAMGPSWWSTLRLFKNACSSYMLFFSWYPMLFIEYLCYLGFYIPRSLHFQWLYLIASSFRNAGTGSWWWLLVTNLYFGVRGNIIFVIHRLLVLSSWSAYWNRKVT